MWLLKIIVSEPRRSTVFVCRVNKEVELKNCKDRRLNVKNKCRAQKQMINEQKSVVSYYIARLINKLLKTVKTNYRIWWCNTNFLGYELECIKKATLQK